VVIVIAVAAWQFTRDKLLFFFAAFAFVTFVPVSNLLFLTGTIMAERFLYLPAAGFSACLALVIYSAAQRLGSRPVAPVVLCLIITALGIRTWKRNLDWRDAITLWTSTVQTVPENYKGRNGVLHSPQCSSGASGRTDFVVDVLDVVIGGLRGDEELVGDLLRRESSCGEAQDIDFAARKTGRILRTAGRAGFSSP
jgi:hypothetical protein